MPAVISPEAISPAIMWVACWEDPHAESTVVPAVRQAGVQPGRPSHVVGLLARLGDAAADDLPDLVGGHAGALQHRLLRDAEKGGRVHAGQRSATSPDRRACCLDDDGLAHDCLPRSLMRCVRRPERA
jgi:hypothetical protein